MRLALIGAGCWGKNYIKTINQLSDFELTYLVSSNPESKALVSSKTILLPTWQALREKSDYDGVIIATPPQTHILLAKNFIDKSLLIEKPLSMNLLETNAFLDLCGDHNILVDYIHLFNPIYIRMKNLIKQSGPVKKIKCVAGNYGPFRENVPILWDWAVHDVAICLDLLGEGLMDTTIEKYNQLDLKESLAFKLYFSGDRSASIAVSNILDEKTKRVTVYTENDVILYDDVAKYLTVNGKIEDIETEINPLAEVLMAFKQGKSNVNMTRLITEFLVSIEGKIYASA